MYATCETIDPVSVFLPLCIHNAHRMMGIFASKSLVQCNHLQRSTVVNSDHESVPGACLRQGCATHQQGRAVRLKTGSKIGIEGEHILPKWAPAFFPVLHNVGPLVLPHPPLEKVALTPETWLVSTQHSVPCNVLLQYPAMPTSEFCFGLFWNFLARWFFIPVSIFPQFVFKECCSPHVLQANHVHPGEGVGHMVQALVPQRHKQSICYKLDVLRHARCRHADQPHTVKWGAR